MAMPKLNNILFNLNLQVAQKIRFASTATNVKMSKKCFNGRTAIITGGARGLGREYALLLSSRGANVVVNDFGGTKSGENASIDVQKKAADAVVDEIRAKNGSAIANYDSICDESGVKRLVDETIAKFGQVDILINNAGILRDKSFLKMTVDDFDAVCQVHLRGSFLATKAVWPIMKAQKYGKIIMTSSTSGIFGNFGQANYAAAKMALIGLSNALSIEGASSNIKVNSIVPLAASRLTESILPGELFDKLDPKFVAPLVGWLCHEDCNESGAIFEAAGGCFGRFTICQSNGKMLPSVCDNNGVESIEQIEKNWNEIASKSSLHTVETFGDHLAQLTANFASLDSKQI